MKNIFSVLFIAIALFSANLSKAQYCLGGPGSTFDTDINGVVLQGADRSINNNSSCPGQIGVLDFTTQEADVVLNSQYSVTVEFGSCGGFFNAAGEVWIDWDQNQTFDPAESIGTWSGLPPVSQTYNFTVPANAVLGATRMRVQLQEGGFNPLNPCANFTWGAVEDYGIMVLATPPPCPSPKNLALISSDTVSAQIGWTSGGSSNWNVEYGPTGFSLGTGTKLSNVTSNPLTVTGLQSGRTYDFYIKDTCSSISSSSFYSGPLRVIIPIAAPHYEGFDSVAVPSLPFGWSQNIFNIFTFSLPSATTSNGVFFNEPVPLSAPNQARFDVVSGGSTFSNDTIILITPPIFDLNTGLNRVRFSGTTIGGQDIIVGTMTDPTNKSTFRTIATVGPLLPTYQEYSVNVTNFTGGVAYLAFKYFGTSTSQDDGYIDNVYWEAIPIHEIGLTQYDSPSNPITLGTQSVGVTVKNYGTDPLANTNIGWEVNGNAQTPFNLTLTGANQLAVDQSVSNIVIGNYNFTNSINIVKSWTSNPNGFVDENQSNDTIFGVFCTGLNGTYTAGAPGDDFPNADLVFEALNSCGLNGNTTINFSPGTYQITEELNQIIGLNGQFSLTLSGTNANNTIFTSVGQGSVTSTLLLDSVKNITLKNLTIQSEANNIGRGVMIRNQCENILIDSCNFIATNPLQTTALQVVGVFMGPDMFSNFTEGNPGKNITISNSSFDGFEQAIQLQALNNTPAVNINILNNTIINGLDGAINLDNIDSLNTIGNKVSNMALPFSDGFFFEDIEEYKINQNEIYVDGDALILSRANDTSGVVAEIINNMLKGDLAGIDIRTAATAQIFNNSVFGNPALNLDAAQGIDCRNNIYIADLGLVFNGFNASFVNFDYNIYKTNGPDFASNNGGVNPDFAAFQAALPLYNINSLNGDPLFNSPIDFRITYGLLANDAGDNSVSVLTDIDGDVRPATGSLNLDIGADEFTPPDFDLGLNALISQKGFCFSDTDSVKFQIINYGLNNLYFNSDSFSIIWDISGVNNQSGTAVFNVDSLASGDTAIVSLSNTVDFSNYGTYYLTAYLSAVWDSTNINDTLSELEINVATLISASGDTTFTLPGGVATLDAFSPILNNVLISEIVQFSTGTGQTNPYPSYMPTGDFDVAELANVGTTPADFSGYSFEVYGAAGLSFSYTIPNNVVVQPQDVLLLGFASFGNQPSNNLYWMNGFNTSSNVQNGYVLKNPSGDIVDVVATNGLTFPPITGISPTDWQGAIPSSSGFAGVFRTGTDNNNASDWVIPSITNTMTIGAFNPNLDTVPSASLNWYLDTNLIDTVPTINVGPFSQNGIYNYVASIQSICGIVYDTVRVEVNIPYPDSGLVDVVVDSIGISDDVLCNASETSIKMYLNNTGSDTVYFIPAAFSLNGLPAISEVIVDTLYPNIQKEVIFNTASILTSNGIQSLKAWVIIQGDTTSTNDTNNFSFTNRNLPNSPIASSDSSYCPGTQVQNIFAQGSGGQLSWYNSAALDTNSFLQNGDTLIPTNTSGATLYFVAETDSFGCVSIPDTVVVGIFGYPNASAGGNTYVCDGSSKTIVASGGVSYVWSNGTQSASNTISPSTPTSYSVTVTDVNGCVAADTIFISIDTLPNVSISAIQNFCSNDGQFALTQGFPTGGVYSGNNVTGGNFFPSSAGFGTDSIFYTFTNNRGCSNSDFQVVTIDSVPNVTFASLPIVCANGTSFSLTGGLPAGGFYSGPGVTSGTFDPNQSGGAGNKFITYTYTDGNGCSNSVINTLTTLPPPTVTLSAFPAICEDYFPFALIGGKPVGGTYSGNGISNDTIYPSLSGTGNITIQYRFTATNGCSAQTSRNITIDAKPAKPNVFIYGTDSLLADVNAPLYQWYYEGQIYPEVTKVIYAQLTGFYQVEAINGTCSSERSNEYYFEILSIEELGNKGDFQIFPNPTNGEVFVKIGENISIQNIEIVNIDGQLITKVDKLNNDTFFFNLNSFTPGIYFINIIDDSQKTYHYKLVKN